jgi:lysophospholipase L1-like esterase
MKNMYRLIPLVLTAALFPTVSVCAAAEPSIKIGLIGDSTVAVESGWGPAFASRFNEQAEIINYAKNGATLEALSGKLDALVELKPDYVLIQLGHNDQKRYDTAVYSDHLRSYVARIRKAGGKAVIVSSVTRRSFDVQGKIVSNMVKNEKYSYQANLTAYANAAEAVAGELALPFIDLHRTSIAHHNKIGREESMSDNFKEGDKTHFNRKGAEAITDLILKEIETAVPKISAWLKSEEELVAARSRAAFEVVDSVEWKDVFFDSFTKDWEKQWTLDGEVGTAKNTPEGIELTAGPEFRNDAHHMVLWTRKSFEGDVRIDYEVVRLDSSEEGVNILYIQATGGGEGPYKKDISAWSDLRRVPAMKTYFNNMQTYHISYAVPGDRDYIRARRYMPNRSGLKGTALAPDYFRNGLFGTGVPHKLTIIKQDRDIFMRVRNAEQTRHYHWHNDKLPPIEEGRIGLRLMFTRASRIKDFRVSVPLPNPTQKTHDE